MEISGYHTPKKRLRKSNQSVSYIQYSSPAHSIQRRKTFIPSYPNNYKNLTSKRNISEALLSGDQEIVTGSKSNKIQKNKENKNDTFSNYINKIYTKESHLNKKTLVNSPKKQNNKIKSNYISNKTLYNSQDRRRSAINSYSGLSQFTKEKNIEKCIIDTSKDGLTINSNYKSSLFNKKLLGRIDNLLHKKKLTKKEKEIILNYFNKSKELESSKNNRINDNNIKTLITKKGQNNNNPKFIENNKALENENTERKKSENEEIKNIVLYKLRNKSSKLNWFKTFFCCIKTE